MSSSVQFNWFSNNNKFHFSIGDVIRCTEIRIQNYQNVQQLVGNSRKCKLYVFRRHSEHTANTSISFVDSFHFLVHTNALLTDLSPANHENILDLFTWSDLIFKNYKSSELRTLSSSTILAKNMVLSELSLNNDKSNQDSFTSHRLQNYDFTCLVINGWKVICSENGSCFSNFDVWDGTNNGCIYERDKHNSNIDINTINGSLEEAIICLTNIPREKQKSTPLILGSAVSIMASTTIGEMFNWLKAGMWIKIRNLIYNVTTQKLEVIDKTQIWCIHSSYRWTFIIFNFIFLNILFSFTN